MTDQVQKIAQLEQVIAQLKVRVFDASESAQQQHEIAEGFKSAIIQIATAVGLPHDAELTVDQVVEKVKELVETSKTETVGTE